MAQFLKHGVQKMFTVQIELSNGNEYEYPFYDLEDALWMADEQSQGGAFKRIAVMDGRNCVSSITR